MSRYVKSFEVKNTQLTREKIEKYLQEKKFAFGNRKGEDVWIKNGVNCKHCIIIKYGESRIELISFIIYRKFEPTRHIGTATIFTESKEETESTSRGFLGGFGKWPLQIIVRKLKKIIKENVK